MTENSYILHELDTEQETIDLPSLESFENCPNYTNIFGNCRFVTYNSHKYLKIDSDEYTIISKYFEDMSAFKRQISSVGENNILNLADCNIENPNTSKLHSYSTRSLNRYTSNMSVTLKIPPNKFIIKKIITAIIAMHHDITQYHMRWKPNIMIDSYIEMDSEYFNLTLKGGIDNVVRLLLSPDINEITNQLIDQVNEEQIPDNEYEDVKINMPVEDYNQYIGFKRPVKDDIGKVCSICFDTIKSTEKRVSITKCCNNVFHTRCLKKWLTKECSLPTCPMCRTDLYPQRHQ